MIVAATRKGIPFLGVVSSGPAVNFINTKKQLKQINNPLCYLTDQIDIPDV